MSAAKIRSLLLAMKPVTPLAASSLLRLKRAHHYCYAPGQGLVSPYHPLFKGVFGFAGHADANSIANPKVDLVLQLARALASFPAMLGILQTLLNGKLVHVESTEANLTRTPMAKLHVAAVIETIFDRHCQSLWDRHEKISALGEVCSDESEGDFNTAFSVR